MLSALILLPVVATATLTPTDGTHVYLPPIATAAHTDPTIATLFSDAVVAAARRHPDQFVVITAPDVAALLGAAAGAAARACHDAACAAHIAEQVGATQIVTTHLARVGGDTALTLTRLNRELEVVVHVESRAPSASPDTLLEQVPTQMSRLLFPGGRGDLGPGALASASGVGLSVALGLIGSALHAASWALYAAATASLEDGRYSSARSHKRAGEALVTASVAVYAVSAAGAVVSALGLSGALLLEEPEL